jgi:hypothetical protein
VWPASATSSKEDLINLDFAGVPLDHARKRQSLMGQERASRQACLRRRGAISIRDQGFSIKSASFSSYPSPGHARRCRGPEAATRRAKGDQDANITSAPPSIQARWRARIGRGPVSIISARRDRRAKGDAHGARRQAEQKRPSPTGPAAHRYPVSPPPVRRRHPKGDNKAVRNMRLRLRRASIRPLACALIEEKYIRAPPIAKPTEPSSFCFLAAASQPQNVPFVIIRLIERAISS